MSTATGMAYRDWIMHQTAGGAAPLMGDDGSIRFFLPKAVAEVNFYPYLEDQEIVELHVVRIADGDSTFFLHFALDDDLEHAKELFRQLAEALTVEEGQQVTHVLIACTSAMTTTLFAAKMNEVAETLKLGYDFTAMSADLALTAGGDYAAVMLAPQAAYLKSQMAAAHPDALVFEVPGKVFGTYDAAGAIRLLMHAFRELDAPGDVMTELKAVRDLSDDCRVLVITLFLIGNSARLGYRLYEHGETKTEGALRKPQFNYADVADFIQMLSVDRFDLHTLDAIAIAVPGVTRHGAVSLPSTNMEPYDLGQALSDRFGVPTFVDNNCNAAAVGCYVSQNEVESLVFYRHAFGHPAGGMGTVIDGRIRKGRMNFSGEPAAVIDLFSFKYPIEEVPWTADGLHTMATCVCATATAFISPEALYVAVDTIDDADEFSAELAKVLGATFVPSVHIVDDYVERVYLGTLAMALQKLRDQRHRFA